MLPNDLEFTEIYYVTNVAVFVVGAVISVLSAKFVKSLPARGLLTLAALAAFSIAFINHSRQQDSKYKTFDV